jgi:hypothetical protein
MTMTTRFRRKRLRSIGTGGGRMPDREKKQEAQNGYEKIQN